MTELIIKNFSCIDDAQIDFATLTILIGPQASGKSVISKLAYFFYDILAKEFRAVEDGNDLDAFRYSLAEEFKKWFPPSAWGARAFSITFRSGQFFAKVSRASTKKRTPSLDVRINLSPYFETRYRELLQTVSAQKEKGRRSDRVREIDYFWRIREAAEKKLQSDLGSNYVEWQIFIPAGRSFFTSLGKAMAAFEYSGMLDPITVQFGRFFTSIREVRYRRYMLGRQDKREVESRDAIARELFGGNLRLDREQEFVEAEDGRKIPFAFLSSGQQELLPLWLTLEYVYTGTRNCLMYIEEPEAHLFPAAQSQIVEQLASTVSRQKSNTKMIITTHSPYVLTQFNILLKAGSISKARPDLSSKIQSIVKRESWLEPGSTAAYAIVGKRVKKIFDSGGLIDGDYLDEVSGNLEREFQSLLEIENS